LTGNTAAALAQQDEKGGGETMPRSFFPFLSLILLLIHKYVYFHKHGK
jgi:hypothetical protein